jgi:hypothetical protein
VLRIVLMLSMRVIQISWLAIVWLYQRQLGALILGSSMVLLRFLTLFQTEKLSERHLKHSTF